MALKNIDESDHVICAFLEPEPGSQGLGTECRVVVRGKGNALRIETIKSHEFHGKLLAITSIARESHQVLLQCVSDLRFAARIEKEEREKNWQQAAKRARETYGEKPGKKRAPTKANKPGKK